MNDEEAFNAALDANPGDWLTRIVFADWLDDRSDPRADGYRVLGWLRLVPELFPTPKDIATRGFKGPGRWNWGGNITGAPYGNSLTDQWLGAACRAVGRKPVGTTFRGVSFDTRREAEDAAALGFQGLTVAQRARLVTLAERRSV